MSEDNVLETLRQRGFVEQISHEEELSARLMERPITFYVGIDPTADSMHVGHLLPVMSMAWMQRAGHKPIAVVGGGTAMVGDPSGKTEMRKLITEAQIAHNVTALQGQFAHFLDFGEGKARMMNNADWLCSLNYIEFLRDIGSVFSVNKMLAAEAYKQRLAKGLSFIEFNYQLLQAYDFLELNRRYGCELQMGGNDQWGNIVAGSDLIRRKTGGRAFALTIPLILTSTGQKMGKTAGGAVWLDPNRLPPFDYYQYWINIPDPDVGRMLRFYTFLPEAEIAELEKLEGADIRKAKAVLAHEATALVHGVDEATKAARGASAMVASSAGADLPTHTVEATAHLTHLLAESGLLKSKSEGRRMIKSGAVKIDGVKITDFEREVTLEELGQDGIVVRVGKKRVIRFVAT